MRVHDIEGPRFQSDLAEVAGNEMNVRRPSFLRVGSGFLHHHQLNVHANDLARCDESSEVNRERAGAATDIEQALASVEHWHQVRRGVACGAPAVGAQYGFLVTVGVGVARHHSTVRAVTQAMAHLHKSIDSYIDKEGQSPGPNINPPSPMINVFRSRQTLTNPQPYVSPSRTVQARVAFVTFEPGGVVIDLMAGPLGSKSAQLPVSLEAVLPRSTWAVAAAGLLQRWARTSAQIEVCCRSSKGTPRMRLRDGTSCMLVELRQAPNSPQNAASPAERHLPDTAGRS